MDLVLQINKHLEQGGNVTEKHNNTSLICKGWL